MLKSELGDIIIIIIITTTTTPPDKHAMDSLRNNS
jgi:hypothetical protein